MPRVFGTDGVRGLANREVTAELALELSVAAARVIIDRGDFDRTRTRPLAVVGREPRSSGQIRERAGVAGLVAAARPSLKKPGLLPRDARVIERKKAGLKKARKATQYSKR